MSWDDPGIGDHDLMTKVRQRDTLLGTVHYRKALKGLAAGQMVREGDVEQMDNKVKEMLANRLAEREAARLIESVDSYGDDNYEDGTVLRFRKKFTPDGRDYLYATLKAGGKWYVTGSRHGADHYRSWTELVLFLLTEGEPVYWSDVEVLI